MFWGLSPILLVLGAMSIILMLVGIGLIVSGVIDVVRDARRKMRG